MKTLKYIFAILILSVSFVSCSDDDENTPVEVNPVEGLIMIYEIPAADHTVQIYSEKTALEVGLGSAFGGGRTLVTMKHVGLNVAADPLFTDLEREDFRFRPGSPALEMGIAQPVALDQVGLRDMYKKPFSSISGGQRQRLAIARCLLFAP